MIFSYAGLPLFAGAIKLFMEAWLTKSISLNFFFWKNFILVPLSASSKVPLPVLDGPITRNISLF